MYYPLKNRLKVGNTLTVKKNQWGKFSDWEQVPMIYSTSLFRITEKYTNKRVWMPFAVKRQTPFFPWSPLASYGHEILSWFVNPVFFRAIVEVSLKEQNIATVILSKIFSMKRLTWHLNLIFIHTRLIKLSSCSIHVERMTRNDNSITRRWKRTPHVYHILWRWHLNLLQT
jgi:hypothetical protein